MLISLAYITTLYHIIKYTILVFRNPSIDLHSAVSLN